VLLFVLLVVGAFAGRARKYDVSISDKESTDYKAWSEKAVAVFRALPSPPSCDWLQEPNPHITSPQVTSEAEKVNKWHCAGCIDTVQTLKHFMAPELVNAATNPAAVFAKFGATCQYIDPTFTEVCQFMFNTMPTEIPNMLISEMLPIDICSCVGACRETERALRFQAFQSITADDLTAAPLPETRGGYSLAAKTANKAFQTQLADLIKTIPAKRSCSRGSDRRAFTYSSVHSDSEQINRWRCDGCVTSITTLYSFMKPVFARSGSVAAATQEFGAACQYVDAEFQELCQTLFNQYPEQAVGMVLNDVIPLDICVCLKQCRHNEREYFTGAFTTFTADAAKPAVA
jgi:hypothetical protein